jgi:signal transduction histidine kinase
MPDAHRLRAYLTHADSDPVIAGVIALACLMELTRQSAGAVSPITVVTATVVCAPLTILRRRPVAATLTEAGVLLIISRLGQLPGVAGDVVVCALAYCCGAYASLRDAGFAVGALIVALQVSMGFSEFPNIEIAFATLAPLWVGHQVGLRSSLVRALAARNRELQDEHDAFARLSVHRERARIARELHDIVAHHLAVIVVQAGAGRMARATPNQRAAQRLTAIRQSGDQALADMARLVDILHTEHAPKQSPATRWQRLLDHAQAGGVHVQIAPLPRDLRLSGELEGHAYRIVREGLTNAIKHAPGTNVHVELTLEERVLEIEIRDHGAVHGQPLGDTGSGLGLVGMRERIESTGGTCTVGPHGDGGWQVHATLPVAAPTVLAGR